MTEGTLLILQDGRLVVSEDETGRRRKLSRPWHGPYPVTTLSDPDVCVSSVYYPDYSGIKVHMSRVKFSPPTLPAGFYRHGGNIKSLGHIPDKMLKDEQSVADSADTPKDGDRPGDESSDEDPQKTNLDEDLVDSGAETRSETKTPRPDLRPEIETRPGRTVNRRYGLRSTLQPPERLVFARDEHI